MTTEIPCSLIENLVENYKKKYMLFNVLYLCLTTN